MTALPFACAGCTSEGCACSESRKSASQRCPCSPDTQCPECTGEPCECVERGNRCRCGAKEARLVVDQAYCNACDLPVPMGSCSYTPKAAGQAAGDGGFWEVAAELWPLHVEKADGYGTDGEPFQNYIAASEAVGEPDEFTCWLRIYEKTTRALNLIRAGRADENLEGLDVAALACGAEALRRRRL